MHGHDVDVMELETCLKHAQARTHTHRGVLEGVAGVAMATPVGTQKRKREIEKKKKDTEEQRGKNSCFIFSLFRFVISSENNCFYSFMLYIEVEQKVFIKS